MLSVLTPVFCKHSPSSSTFQSSALTSSKIPPAQATSMTAWPRPSYPGVRPPLSLRRSQTQRASVCGGTKDLPIRKHPPELEDFLIHPNTRTWRPSSLQSERSQSGCDSEQLISRSRLQRVLLILITSTRRRYETTQPPRPGDAWFLYLVILTWCFSMFRGHLVLP